MLRRSVSELAFRRSFSRVPRRATAQVPSYLSSRSFSVHHKNDLDSGGKTQSNLAKIITGSVALGSAVYAASYFGFLDGILRKDYPTIGKYTKVQNDNKSYQDSKEIYSHDNASDLNKMTPQVSSDESDITSAGSSHGTEDINVKDELTPQEAPVIRENKIFPAEDAAVDNSEHVPGDSFPDPERIMSLDDETSKSVEDVSSFESPEVEHTEDKNEAVGMAPTFTPVDTNATKFNAVPGEESLPKGLEEVGERDVAKGSASLLDDYGLGENSREVNEPPIQQAKEDIRGSYITEDGKLVLDFLQALHAAEKKQAELDAKSFAEEKRVMKDKYEKELKDARVREVMYAEREDMLEKELTKERSRAAAAFKSLQENLEQKFKTEIELKEKEVEHKLMEQQDVSKAELAAAIASEKASHLEKMAEANLHINALCMAFYARSEEVSQRHSAHKLALGTVALEGALAKGLPFEKEIDDLRTNLTDSDEETLIAMVLSSLPEDLQRHGTKTLPQLNQKFEDLKDTLRHFSLIPPGGGGVLAHSLASVASFIKVKEVDNSGDGIESLINKVDNLLAQAKLSEAADSLENGVEGTQAAEVVSEWVKQARNRAVTEQALEVLRAYATSISLT